MRPPPKGGPLLGPGTPMALWLRPQSAIRVGGRCQGAQNAHRICYASCRSSRRMIVAAIGVTAMSGDVRSQLGKYRNQPDMAPRTNYSAIETTTEYSTNASN